MSMPKVSGAARTRGPDHRRSAVPLSVAVVISPRPLRFRLYFTQTHFSLSVDNQVGYVVITLKHKGQAAFFHDECKFEDMLSNVSQDRPRKWKDGGGEERARRGMRVLWVESKACTVPVISSAFTDLIGPLLRHENR